MGFDQTQARQALDLCNNDIDLAVDRILSGNIPSTNAVSVESSPVSTRAPELVQASISQYSIPNGRSACTCVALQTASTLLQKLNTISPNATIARETISPQFLQSILFSGVELYNELSKEASIGGVEHLTPEEVLNAVILHPIQNLHMQLLGSVRQGILSNENHDNPLGLYQVISQCLSDCNSTGDEWMALVITKTPETVCIFLPPNGLNTYIILDSHPRPILSTEGFYAAFHTSLEDCVSTLKTIFPATELGNEVGELMAAMYNSFDVYPLQRHK